MRKIQWATVILAAATFILLLIDLLIGWEWVKNWSTENTIGTLEAVGTVAVAALAIWGDEIKATFAGPQLKLSLNPDSDVSHAATTRRMCLVRYYHLQVENLRPSVPALNAKVMLVALYKKLGKQHFEKVPLVVPVQLTFPYPTDPAHERTPSIRSAVLCDFGQIIEGNPAFSLTPYHRPFNFNGIVHANETMLATMIAEADNGVSNRLTVEISWDGQWHDDALEMKTHLKLSEVHEPI